MREDFTVLDDFAVGGSTDSLPIYFSQCLHRCAGLEPCLRVPGSGFYCLSHGSFSAGACAYAQDLILSDEAATDEPLYSEFSRGPFNAGSSTHV